MLLFQKGYLVSYILVLPSEKASASAVNIGLLVAAALEPNQMVSGVHAQDAAPSAIATHVRLIDKLALLLLS